MASSDDDHFRVRPSAPKSRTGPRAPRFITQVLKAVSKAGARAVGPSGGGASGGRRVAPSSTFGRGRVAASVAGTRLGSNARRVVIKSRFVVLKKAGASSVATHLRYIERDGVTRDGRPGQAYGADTDAPDLRAFEERGRGDRHQFRFIVSAEDAGELEDLRGVTRQLMQRMEVDLETRLDWVAVDHWDTDNPHTHIVLRGRTHAGMGVRKGQDLVIAPDYMARGMRLRASEIVTEWLGPRTEREIHQGLLREVVQERLTSLDRTLLRLSVVDVADLTEQPRASRGREPKAPNPALLRARLQQLETMDLAERLDANRWQVSADMERTLTAMGERGDILRTLQRAMKGERREFRIEPRPAVPIVGRIAAKGLVDELHERGYLVVDGMDGRAHYLPLPASTDLAALPVGGVVEARPPEREREVDRSIAARSKGGIYSTADHLAELRQAGSHDPQATVEVHVRRLEALRRSGVVERLAEGVWTVPADVLQKAQQHDARRVSPGIVVELQTHLPIERQVRALGATWLDRQLVGGAQAVALPGFGAQARGMMDRRVDFLVEQGLAERRGPRVVLARNLLATLRDRDLAATGRALQDETGLAYRPLKDGERASGVYRRTQQLVSGRFAMLDDGKGFQLVPWRPVIESRLGQQVSAIVRGSTATWELGRQRGPSI